MEGPHHLKLDELFESVLRIGVDDGRIFVGKFVAVDKDVNVILCDCCEFVPISEEDRDKDKPDTHILSRQLNSALIHGKQIVSIHKRKSAI
ncbi:Small nuclear ribonucleoprotein-associated protein B [Trichinella pseudospiralis]|uniref:Small nuclear ribonucleoprotein-associated protein B n=1 Tax=Trichinella pseudospiralis TaxID=6337 RepID=A0A0V1FH85_TRIPS|nr:Small nuclear ribonucleoprotein-associated protein B [Trichinella pseudospiralis]